VTFPWGAGAEAWTAWLACGHIDNSILYFLVMLVVPTNILGGLAVYSGIVKKGLQSLKPPPAEQDKPVEQGVLFPANEKGKRSSLAGGVTIWEAAAKAVDPALATAITKEKQWRQNYAKHVVALAEGSCRNEDVALKSAEVGLATIYETFDFVRAGQTLRLGQVMKNPSPDRALHSACVSGTGALAPLCVPYSGKQLRGADLLAQLKNWSAYGCAEAAAMDAIAKAVANPEWLDLRGHCFVILGATSAMGPLEHLLSWGATVIAIARKRTETWEKLMRKARASAGSLVFPVNADSAGMDDATMAEAGGADLLVDTPEIAAWLKTAIAEVEKTRGTTSTTIGVYTYLDGDAHVRVSLACDAIIQEVLSADSGKRISLAYMQTPSLTYTISEESHFESASKYRDSKLRLILPANARPPCTGGASKDGLAKPLLLGEAGARPPRYIHDGLINMQGPNYALAKTMQLWRAVLARSRDGRLVSMNIAPAARTASMVAGNNKNAGSVATGLDGMGHFSPLVVFDSETVSACMAALLVHDLRSPEAPANPRTALAHPWDLASCEAFHGGSFRVGVKPQALGPLFFLYGKLFGAAKQPVVAPTQ